jgi:sodium pump decarboxylase gamma subunit
MTIFEMLNQSAILTVLGMLVVFVFLWIMIMCINFIAIVIKKVSGGSVEEQPVFHMPQNLNGEVTPEIVSVISAAVAEYQKKE